MITRKNFLFALLGFSVVAASSLLVFFYLGSGSLIQISTTAGTGNLSVTLHVNYGNGTITSHDINLEEGVSALDVLGYRHNVTAKEFFGLGMYIVCIDSVCENKDTKSYWVYYINGVFALGGSGSYVAKNGDVITFNLTNSSLPF